MNRRRPGAALFRIRVLYIWYVLLFEASIILFAIELADNDRSTSSYLQALGKKQGASTL